MIETIAFAGWENCVKISNGVAEVIVTTEVGPRIVKAGFSGSRNFLYLLPEQQGKTGGTDWRIYGGHRLWHAPEAIPRSYYPDNNGVSYNIDGHRVTFTQEKELSTGLVKEIEIEMMPDRNEWHVVHRIINQNLWSIELAVWALSVMSPGGIAIVPQEPYGEGDAYLLPARPLVLWHYTKMNDPRWSWGDQYIRARHDAAYTSEQKIGVLNKQGWIAYAFEDERLTKHFEFKGEGNYADYGCNCEVYINDRFLEIETLSPLTRIEPGATLEHAERWVLSRRT